MRAFRFFRLSLPLLSRKGFLHGSNTSNRTSFFRGSLNLYQFLACLPFLDDRLRASVRFFHRFSRIYDRGSDRRRNESGRLLILFFSVSFCLDHAFSDSRGVSGLPSTYSPSLRSLINERPFGRSRPFFAGPRLILISPLVVFAIL